MASLESVNFKNNKIIISLTVSRREYNLFGADKDFLVLPSSSFDITLVTGTLGNSNRIMLPNKVLKRNEIEHLTKKVPSRIVKTKKGKYLIIQLDGSEDVPKFND